MSQRDLAAVLRAARPAAPPELRERVRLIVAAAPAVPRRRLTWRRAALVLVPVAATLAAAVVLTRGGTEQHWTATPPPALQRSAGEGAVAAEHALAPARTGAAVPAPSPTRPQRYAASLELRERSAAAISAATKRAIRIAASLAGYPLRLTVHAVGSPGSADLVFRVPGVHVQDAVRRLSALGTVVSEDVSVEDLQPQLNATNDLIARLQRQLAALRAQTQTTLVQRQVAALTARIERLQRSEATTLRAAHFATVELQLTTGSPPPPPVRHAHGPLHGLGIAFHWLWVGAVYVLALGAPLAAIGLAFWLAVRALRRRREDALLSRP